MHIYFVEDDLKIQNVSNHIHTITNLRTQVGSTVEDQTQFFISNYNTMISNMKSQVNWPMF